MYIRLSIFVVLLFALGTVDSKHKHKKENEPEFIRNLTNNQRSSFLGISKNPGLSFQQKDDKLVKWAETNNLSMRTIFRIPQKPGHSQRTSLEERLRRNRSSCRSQN